MIPLTEPSFTHRIAATELSRFQINSLIYGDSISEDRAKTVSDALGAFDLHQRCLALSDDAIISEAGDPARYNLYEADDLRQLIRQLSGVIAIDLTSLEHRVWAPLVRTILLERRTLIALYAEPNDYQRDGNEAGAPYDLSSTKGIEPLPGFARIGLRKGDQGAFAPLLGFEGARLKHIFDQEDVDARQTSPVVGIPGFRLEYSTHSYIANRDVLDTDRMEDRVELASASCPFEAFDALSRIHGRTGNGYLRIAPIGTKPHALGAVLYAILNEDQVELIYDHPVRRESRTEGSRGIYVYDVSGFLQQRMWPLDES